MRSGVTLEDVTRAADLILERGDRPTIEGVRTVLGTGSPATVNAHLKAYFQALPARLHLPASIATAAAELYKAIRDSAQADVEQREAEALAALKLERDKLRQERNDFEMVGQQLRESIAGLTAELAGGKTRIGDLERQLLALQGELTAQGRVATAATARADAAIEERDRLARKHQDELTQLKERAEGNEKHLLTQIDDLKSQLKRAAADREKDQAAAAKRVADLEGKIAETATELADQRKEAIRVSADLSREQRARAGLEAELRAQAESSARELDAMKVQRTSAMEERDAERTTVSTLRAERDGALREAAKLQGRVEALEKAAERQAGDAKAEGNDTAVDRLPQGRTP